MKYRNTLYPKTQRTVNFIGTYMDDELLVTKLKEWPLSSQVGLACLEASAKALDFSLANLDLMI